MALTAEEKEARRAYYREWRDKNRDRVRQTQQKFWKRKAEELKKGQVEA